MGQFLKNEKGLVNFSQEDLEFERYRSIVNTLNGYEDYLLDQNGFILSSNLEAVSVTGYEEWEVIGAHISKFYTIEDQLKNVPQNDLEKACVKKIFVSTGLRIKKRNSSFWAKSKLRALTNEGQLTGFKLTIQDVTHKAVNNHRLKKLKDEYLNLFNNSFVGIFKLSLKDYHILMMNEKARQITGLHGEQRKFNELFEDDHFRDFLTFVLREKRVESFELKVAGKDQWLALSCRYFSNGNFVEGVMTDITDLKGRDKELKRIKNELDQFIYHASHEMRGPLATMLGIINLIGYEKDIDAAWNYCTILKEKVNGLDQLLKSIVAISLNNQDEISRDNIVWQDVVPSLVREMAVKSSIRVNFYITQTHLFAGDLTRIRIILRNLISNSFKFSNPAAANPSIEITIVSKHLGVEIEIKDNGIGIDPEYLREIFRMFYKATTLPKGHGLGLYAAKVMIDKLKGTIRVSSELGEGTTFSLFFPNHADNANLIS